MEQLKADTRDQACVVQRLPRAAVTISFGGYTDRELLLLHLHQRIKAE